MKSAKPKEDGRLLRALRSLGNSLGIFHDAVLAEPPIVTQDERAVQVKEVLFRKDPERILKCLREKENLLCAAKLLLNEDYIYSAAWAISFAAKNGVDLSLAIPYLEEMASHEQRNARCYAVRALTQHYINVGDRPRLRARMAIGGEDLIRETAEAFLGEVGKGNPAAILTILEALSDRDPDVRKFSAYVLDNAPIHCTPETRGVLRSAIVAFKLHSPLLRIEALRFMDDAIRSIDSQK